MYIFFTPKLLRKFLFELENLRFGSIQKTDLEFFDILPSSLSPKWNKFLREEIRFNGIVIADDLSMRGLDEYGDITEKVNLFIKSGIDLATLIILLILDFGNFIFFYSS